MWKKKRENFLYPRTHASRSSFRSVLALVPVLTCPYGVVTGSLATRLDSWQMMPLGACPSSVAPGMRKELLSPLPPAFVVAVRVWKAFCDENAWVTAYWFTYMYMYRALHIYIHVYVSDHPTVRTWYIYIYISVSDPPTLRTYYSMYGTARSFSRFFAFLWQVAFWGLLQKKWACQALLGAMEGGQWGVRLVREGRTGGDSLLQ